MMAEDVRKNQCAGKRRITKDGLSYFWMYYRIPVILAVIFAVIAVSLVHTAMTEKPDALQVMLLDSHLSEEGSRIADAFASDAGIDQEKNDVTVVTDRILDGNGSGYQMGSLADLYSEIGNGTLDVCAMTEEDFGKYSDADAFLDLRDIFTEEELESFSGVYTDGSGRVTGVRCDDAPKIRNAGGYDGTAAYAGVLYNSEHRETAAQFLTWLCEETGK